jgi:hypothetical protein
MSMPSYATRRLFGKHDNPFSFSLVKEMRWGLFFLPLFANAELRALNLLN